MRNATARRRAAVRILIACHPYPSDDGSARPLTEDLSTGSGDGEDITWDADTAEAGEVPAVAGATSGTRQAGAEPHDGEAGDGPEMAEPEMAGPDGEAEFTEDDVAFLSASQEADAASGTVTEGAPGPDAAPAIAESGRWFRPAKAKKKYVPIPPEDQADSARIDVAPADPEPGGAVAAEEPPKPGGAGDESPDPGDAEARRRREEAAELRRVTASPAEAEAAAGG